jgi:hypoxanthine-DNA glycosylase
LSGRTTPIESFPPIAAPDARVLVLGSMPGAESLRAARYYAHPRNAFWWIMGELFGAGLELAYAERERVLRAHGVAVWDVLRSCRRPASSLDSAIERDTEVANDLARFLAEHRSIAAVFFNGGKAEEAWRRHVAPGLAGLEPAPRRARLPSTSPAYAGLSREDKLERWGVVASAAAAR